MRILHSTLLAIVVPMVMTSPTIAQDAGRVAASAGNHLSLIESLKAAGARIQEKDGKPVRVSFRGTNASREVILKVAGLSTIRSLDLTGCEIGDDDLAALAGMKIGQLQLSSTQVTDAGMEHVAGMKSLQILHVDDTTVGDRGLGRIVTLPLLMDVRVARTRITSTGLGQLASASQIWRLSIGGSDIRDESLSQLKALPRLSSLEIKNAEVTDHGLEILSSFTGLRQITLADTQVTQTAVEKLKAARPGLTVSTRKTPKPRPAAGSNGSQVKTASQRVPRKETPGTQSTQRQTDQKTDSDPSGPDSKTSPRSESAKRPAVSQTEVQPSGLSQQQAIEKLRSLGAEVETRGGKAIRVKFSGDYGHVGDSQLSFIPELTSLESLGLSRTSVTDDFLKRLATLQRLKTLRLHLTNVTWIGISELEEQIPGLKVFATTPTHSSSPWVMWVALAAIPVFLFTFVSFVRVFFSTLGNMLQMKAGSERGEAVSAESLLKRSAGNPLYSAAQGFGLFFGLIGGSFVVSGIGELMFARGTANWPGVDGDVVVSRVINRVTLDHNSNDDDMAYEPVIVYRYSVDGTEHTGDRIAIYRLSNIRAKVIDQEFPIGPTTVYYNSADPSEAVLKPGTAAESYIPVGLGSMGLLIGLSVFIGARRYRRRAQQRQLDEQFDFQSSVE